MGRPGDVTEAGRPVVTLTPEQEKEAGRVIKMHAISSAIMIILTLGALVGIVFALTHFKPWEAPHLAERFVTAAPVIGGLIALTFLVGGVYTAVKTGQTMADHTKYTELRSMWFF